MRGNGGGGGSRAAVSDWEGYARRWAALHGGADPGGFSAVPRGWLRMGFRVGLAAARAGATAPLLTAVGLLLCLLVPVTAAAGAGWLLAGAVLVVLCALADTLDGAVAVITGRASRLGYLYDSVCDRIGEAAWLVALWLAGVPAWLVLGAGGLAWLHEYIRARATAAGMSGVGTVTVAERPTRVIATVVALLWAGAVDLAGVTAGQVPGVLSGTRATAGPGAVAAAGASVATIVWLLLGLVGLVQLLRAVGVALAHRPAPTVDG